MKSLHLVRSAAILTLWMQAETTRAQGPLSPPPGPPAPTMKSIDQVEARTIINATNTPGDSANQFIISQPGSYYLTGNLTGVSGKTGISVTASNVSIDLNGFSLIGVSGSLFGIRVPAVIGNLVVRNGVVRDWGGEGLSAYNANNSRFKDVKAYGNGVWGLVIGVGSGLESCQAFANGAGSTGGGGMYARFSSAIIDCVAEGNTTYGILTEDGCLIRGCSASDTALGGGANGHGIVTGLGANVSGSAARSNAGTGILVSNESVVSSCAATNNTDGIDSGYYTTVSNCTAGSNKGTGIIAGFGCNVTACSATRNGSSGAPGVSGIKLGNGSTLTHSLLVQNNLAGINAAVSCFIAKCSSFNNNGTGILVGGSCTVQECLVIGNAAGISLTGDGNRIDGNNLARNSPDIQMSGSSSPSGQSVIIRNSVSARFTVVAGDDVAPQVPAATASSPWANLAQP